MIIRVLTIISPNFFVLNNLSYIFRLDFLEKLTVVKMPAGAKRRGLRRVF
jgi:hypothetical protein